jgi:uncharacterized protein YbjT (DUF2867 family)
MSGPRIAVLGAGGLIGQAVTADLMRRGFAVLGLARAATAAQVTALQGALTKTKLLELSDAALGVLLAEADIVINCLGVLQGKDSDAVHRVFAARLAALCAPSKLLIHLSVPGVAHGDTEFSRSKRAGEAAIVASGAPFVILRPGFVVADAAYGGSALVRSLAALPFLLPRRESHAPFAATAVSDIGETIARVAARWRVGEKQWCECWDVMEEAPGTVGEMVETFRDRFGGPRPLARLPGPLMTLGAVAGDLAGGLGWRPPIRSTALAELRRGVKGDPGPWMRQTGFAPRSARAAVAALPATVRERWFARRYLFKALALATLTIFWCASGVIALTAGFEGARGILLAHGFAFLLAHALTLISSAMDVSIGLLIAIRRTSRFGLVAGLALSLGYMALAALLTPDLWVEPLGALVKTGPAIILMLFCLAVSDNR